MLLSVDNLTLLFRPQCIAFLKWKLEQLGIIWQQINFMNSCTYMFLYLGDLTEHIQPTRGLTVTCFVQSFKIYTYKLRYILNSLQKTYITLAAYTWYFNTCEVMSVKDN